MTECKKKLQTGKSLSATYQFKMIVSRRTCLGNVWQKFKNGEELYKKIAQENEHLRKQNQENEERMKQMASEYEKEMKELELQLISKMESLNQEKKKVDLYLFGEKKLRMEKEKELEQSNLAFKELLSKFENLEKILETFNDKSSSSSHSSLSYSPSHYNNGSSLKDYTDYSNGSKSGAFNHNLN